jgi:hypothetical protein
MQSGRSLQALVVITLLAAAGCQTATAPTATPLPAATDKPAGLTAEPAQPTAPPALPTAAPGAGNPTAPPAGGAAEACTLLTTDDVQAVVGTEVTGTIPTPGYPSICLYLTATNPAGAFSYWPGGGPLWTVYESSQSLEPVSGVGDSALWEAQTASLIVLKGDSLISITAGMGSDELSTRQQWAKQLAAIVVSRL